MVPLLQGSCLSHTDQQDAISASCPDGLGLECRSLPRHLIRVLHGLWNINFKESGRYWGASPGWNQKGCTLSTPPLPQPQPQPQSITPSWKLLCRYLLTTLGIKRRHKRRRPTFIRTQAGIGGLLQQETAHRLRCR